MDLGVWFMGAVCGAILTMFFIAVWSAFESRAEKRREEKRAVSDRLWTLENQLRHQNDRLEMRLDTLCAEFNEHAYQEAK